MYVYGVLLLCRRHNAGALDETQQQGRKEKTIVGARNKKKNNRALLHYTINVQMSPISKPNAIACARCQSQVSFT